MPNLIATDDANRDFVGARNPDDVLHVLFYMRATQNNFLSAKEGRPIFDNVPFITIQAPGNNLSIIDTPVREDHKVRFPRHWAVFMNQQSESPDELRSTGTPVEAWPTLTKAQAEELKGIKFFTVEQIANCSDAQIAALGMQGPMLRKKAVAYLENARNSALAQQQAAELAKKDQQISDLQGDVKRIAAQLQAFMDSGGQRPKRKYRRKHKEPQQQPVT